MTSKTQTPPSHPMQTRGGWEDERL
jgi:hypothetical protein